LSNALGAQFVLSANSNETAQELAQAGAQNAQYGSLCTWSTPNLNPAEVTVIYVDPPYTESEGVANCPGATGLSGIGDWAYRCPLQGGAQVYIAQKGNLSIDFSFEVDSVSPPDQSVTDSLFQEVVANA
jgi:hypothetical protein